MSGELNDGDPVRIRPGGMAVTIRFDRLGVDPDTKKHKRPEPDHFTREQVGPADELTAAHTVSVGARRLRPVLDEHDLIVRLTTPDGRPSSTVAFQLLDATTRARFGHGLAWALNEAGERLPLSPFTHYEPKVKS